MTTSALNLVNMPDTDRSFIDAEMIKNSTNKKTISTNINQKQGLNEDKDQV